MPVIRNLLFVHIPKTGGQTILRMMGLDPYSGPDEEHLCGTRSLCHLTALQIRDRLGPIRFAECFRFSIVRHPQSRLVSEWAYRRRQGRITIPFTEFALDCYNPIDVHLLPQHEFIYGRGKRLVHCIFRFEHLMQLGPFLFGQPTPHVNASPHLPWQDYYDRRTSEVVRHRYAEDFRLFHYNAY